MHVSALTWIITVVVLLAVLVVDAMILGRRPHVPTTRESATAVGLYVLLAIIFGVGLHFVAGPAPAGEFFAGWLTEYSLSIDNLFIFLLIMRRMQVPRESQQFGLLVGIMLALVFRGVFIALGAALIANLAWVFVLFGGWLLYTAFDLVRDYLHRDGPEENEAGAATEGALLRWMKHTVPTTGEFAGDRLVTRSEGKIVATSLFFVVVALGTTDVMFALDSIPAIYGLTAEPYIVFTANVFALMGLRQLYFLLGDLLKRLVYLPLGLAVLLTFIGVKLVLHAAHHYGWDAALGFNGEISTPTSLAVIVLTLLITALASILKSRRTSAQPAGEHTLAGQATVAVEASGARGTSSTSSEPIHSQMADVDPRPEMTSIGHPSEMANTSKTVPETPAEGRESPAARPQ